MTARHDKIARLRSLPSLTACSERDLITIASLMDEVAIPAGKVLIREDAPAFDMFIVVDGSASVRVGERLIGRAGPGDVVGEIALLDLGPRSATVTAETPMRVLTTDPRSFMSLIGVPELARSVAEGLVQRIRAAAG